MVIENEQDLGKSINNEEETIKIKGKLAPRIKRIWYMDRLLWCVCLACLAVAIAALLASPVTYGGFMTLSLVAGTPAACIMGTSVASTAVLTAVSGGGIIILKNLRHDYWLEFINDEYIILHRK
ncbi:MAG: hypothetical protein LBQ71_15475 [Hungatella sp.]|jgi:hypothetical protein|nr:hypothetical protein [Hungatella sp.]